MLSQINEHIVEKNIDLTWRKVLLLIAETGIDYVVKGNTGSFIGDIRRQIPILSFKILTPGERPLAPRVSPFVPVPASEEGIERYFLEKLMNDKPAINEEYCYGMYIMPQLQRVIDVLAESGGNTNQATMSIGDTTSVFMADPPCLRVISFKVFHRALHMSIFYRSWDAFAGMPMNLGGLQLLKEFVLEVLIERGLDLVDGHIFGYSDGAHVYGQYFNEVNKLNIHKMEVSKEIRKEQEEFIPQAEKIKDALMGTVKARLAARRK